jgi:hypothetical protein
MLESDTFTSGGWLWWPLTLAVSAFATSVVVTMQTPPAVRLLITMWFLFVCPGMAIIRLLSIRDRIIEWGLAVIVSLSVDLLIALALLYAGLWSAWLGLLILTVFCLTGGAVQMLVLGRQHGRVTG